MNVYEKLMKVQTELKAPKGQFNSFGKYNYRSCEDILESLKPLLAEVKAIVSLTDEILQVGDRFYVKAIARFTDIEKGDHLEVSALAREDETKKGMDLAQVTGSVSSYARKYALNGMFCIDDTKDSDATNKHGKDDKEPLKKKTTNEGEPTSILTEAQIKRLYAIAYKAGFNREVVKGHMLAKYKIDSMDKLNKTQYDEMCAGYEKSIK